MDIQPRNPSQIATDPVEAGMSEIEGALFQQVSALLSGTLFTGYSDRAHLRADDLAVRERAAGRVLDAKTQLGTLISRWHERHIPPPTRDMPVPPAALLTELRAMRDVENRLGDLESKIRSAPVPDVSDFWSRVAGGRLKISTLLEYDRALIDRCEELRKAMDSIEEASTQALSFLDQTFKDVAQLLRSRSDYLRDG